MNTDVGWHTDISDIQLIRYWDGNAWTAQRRWNGVAWADVPAATGPIAAAAPRRRHTRWWLIGAAIIAVIVIVAAVNAGSKGKVSTSAFCSKLAGQYDAVASAVIVTGRVENAIGDSTQSVSDDDISALRTGAAAATALAPDAPAALKADLTGLGRGLSTLAGGRFATGNDLIVENAEVIAWRALHCQ